MYVFRLFMLCALTVNDLGNQLSKHGQFFSFLSAASFLLILHSKNLDTLIHMILRWNVGLQFGVDNSRTWRLEGAAYGFCPLI